MVSMCICTGYMNSILNLDNAIKVLLSPFTAPSLSKVTELLTKMTSELKHNMPLNRSNSNIVIRKSHNKTVLHERMLDEKCGYD